MKSLSPLVMLFAAGFTTAGAPAQTTSATLASNATVYASGLEGPRGLTFGPDGTLYVAEAGLAGTTSTVGTCPQVIPPIGPYVGGPTARISKVDTARNRTTLASGLPSARTANGDYVGVADVAFLNGSLYAMLAGGGCSHGNSTQPNAIIKVNQKNGRWTYVTDLSSALLDHPAKYTSPDDYEPDGSWFGMIASEGLLYAVEPNHGQIFSIAPSGRVRQVIDVSASQGHIVPTSIVAVDDVLYVGNLGLFPIDPQWERVITVAKDIFIPNPLPGFDGPEQNYARWKIVSSKAGFTTIVGMKVGPDGLLYVLELSDAPGFPSPGKGKVVRVKRNGTIEEVVTGLVVPTGMTFGPDGALYISNFGAAPGAAGQILRVSVQGAF